jgi:hypothetical protein
MMMRDGKFYLIKVGCGAKNYVVVDLLRAFNTELIILE